MVWKSGGVENASSRRQEHQAAGLTSTDVISPVTTEGRCQGNPPPAGANAAATGGSIVSGITEVPTVAPDANPTASAPSPSVLFSEAVSNAQHVAVL